MAEGMIYAFVDKPRHQSPSPTCAAVRNMRRGDKEDGDHVATDCRLSSRSSRLEECPRRNYWEYIYARKREKYWQMTRRGPAKRGWIGTRGGSRLSEVNAVL